MFFFFCIYLMFALNCVIAAVVFTRKAWVDRAVFAHCVTKDPGFDSWQEQENLFFSKAFRLALELCQHSM